MRRRASEGGQAVRRLDGQILSFVLWLLTAYPPIRLPAQQVDNSGALFLVFPVGVLGGAIYLVDYGDLDRTDATGNTIGRISPRNLEFVASYAAGIAGAVTFGVNYKLVQFVVDCSGDCTNLPSAKGTTHAVDVGGQVAAGPEGALRLGVAVRNIGFKLQVNNRDQADALPARLLIGALYRIVLPAGRDVGYQRLLRVRGGYAFVRDGLSGPSVGLGFETGAIGVDLARSFLAGSDLVVANPTFFSFRVVF